MDIFWEVTWWVAIVAPYALWFFYWRKRAYASFVGYESLLKKYDIGFILALLFSIALKLFL